MFSGKVWNSSVSNTGLLKPFRVWKNVEGLALNSTNRLSEVCFQQCLFIQWNKKERKNRPPVMANNSSMNWNWDFVGLFLFLLMWGCGDNRMDAKKIKRIHPDRNTKNFEVWRPHGGLHKLENPEHFTWKETSSALPRAETGEELVFHLGAMGPISKIHARCRRYHFQRVIGHVSWKGVGSLEKYGATCNAKAKG